MSLASPRRRSEIADQNLIRLRRAILGLLTVGAGVGAGWLGILLAEHIGKVLLTALAGALLWMLMVSAIDFFRTG